MVLADPRSVNNVAHAPPSSEPPPQSGTRPEPSGYELTILTGLQSGTKQLVGAGGLTIGASENCALRLTDPGVAPLHCRLELTDGKLRIRDLGSPAGVSINGVIVREADVDSACLLQLGQSQISIEPNHRPATPELSTRNRFGPVLGKSREMRRLFSILEKAARTDRPLLLTGERGVGKELLARAIHAASNRASGPFVVVNCGALAESLLEAQLFGREGPVGEGLAGAFLGAQTGTLYLAEIKELPARLQPRLMRFLECGQIRPAGSNATPSVDLRIIAGTSTPLAESVNRGIFQHSLHARLAAIEIRVPALRERAEDIVLLANHFYQKYAGSERSLPDELVEALAARTWPGNADELREFIEGSISLGWLEAASDPQDASALSHAVLSTIVPTHLTLKDARNAWTNQFEFLYVKALLEKSSWDLGVAAELAGVHRRSMQRLVANLNLRKHASS